MATLEKIRNRAGLLVAVVGVALFAFIIGDFLNSGSTYFRQSQEKIAEVNGTAINIQEYQARVDEMTEIYKMQSGAANIQEELQSQIRQTVFQAMIQEIVLGEETAKLGLSVGSDELFDMVQGDNISPVIQQMPMFVNPQTGVFDKAALLNFLKAIDDNNITNATGEEQAQLLQAKGFWLFWEKNLKRQRLEQKYTTLLSRAMTANRLDAKDAFESSVVNADIVYTMQPYASMPDSVIKVSKSEVEKLYNRRKEMFKQQEGRVLTYVTADIRPSQEDYTKAQTDIEAVKAELETSDRVADVVNESSETPFMDVFVSADSFDPELKQFATTATVGSIYGPVFENDRHRLFKLVDKVSAPDSVKVSHIMVSGSETQADSLMEVLLQGGDFAELARAHSIDQTSENGGELGWFTEVAALMNLGEEFKNVAFSLPLNKPAKVKSSYGIHLVKITEKTPNIPKYKVADIEMTVSPSSQTYSNIYNQLNQFVTTNNTIAKLSENAQEAGYTVSEDVVVTAADQLLANIANSRQVIRWAFENNEDDLSEIFECNDKFVVAAVQGVQKEGYRSLASVTPILEAELKGQKKGEEIAAGLIAKNLASVEDYAAAMGGSTVDSVKFINFNTRRLAGIGVEPNLNAAVALLEAGKVSSPVKGNNGVYVFQTITKNRDSKPYDEAEEIRQLNASNVYRFEYTAIQSLVSKAKVEDFRIRFY